MNPAAFAARKKNERRIIEYIIANGETSRVTLANALGISTATVTNIVTELLERDFLFESRKNNSTVGRKTTLLKFNNKMFYVLTLEIRTSQELILSICDLNGDLLTSHTVSCEIRVSPTCTRTQVMKNIIQELNQFLNNQPDHFRSKVKMIGLCLHGMVNASQTCDMPGVNWKNMNLAASLQSATGMPVYSEGITRILANYEMRFIDPSERNVIFLNMFVGVGLVHFFNRKMVMGKTGIAGEIGHISLNSHGPQCYCGNRGCFEYYCGMNFILQRAQEFLVEENKQDPFYDMVINKKMPLTPTLLFQAQKAGSLLIHELLCDASEHLGDALVTLYNIFDPDRIIVATEPDIQDNFLFENAKIEARSRIINQFSRDIVISSAHLGPSELHRAITDFLLRHYLDTL